MAALSAAAVANEFLDLAAQEPQYPIDPMKLQKLVYYAHAWWLAHTGSPLFEDDIEAWPWGPVVRNLYGQFNHFGRSSISGCMARELMKTDEGKLSFSFHHPRLEDQRVRDFVKEIWDIHKTFSGVQLSNATHASGEPWTVVKEQYSSLDGKPRIPNEVIRDVFKAKINVAG